ncbi:MAG: sigma-54 dependent transcriptional regulator [Gammaproteobacteria bacterium]
MSTSTIMVVEDDSELAEALTDTLQLAGYEVIAQSDGEEALQALEAHRVDLVISDIHMPKMDGHKLLKRIKARHTDLPVMLMTAYGSIQQAVDAMRDGAIDYLVKPFEAEVLVNMVSRYVGDPSAANNEVVAEDAKSIALMQMAKRVAASDATVMITGESGSGKEVLARYIHAQSSRATAPFVAINCAAIPENMLEATLFGYEKGAYTGAYKACPGKFEQAQGGTLLLDEITEMDLGLQAKLLRVLQEREVERLGGTNVIALDVRVLATSNRDLKQAVAENQFREDLYYRLNVFPLNVAALRDRPDDIVPLAENLLQRHAVASGRSIPTLSAAAKKLLANHPWEGNVRELDNVVQRCLILQAGDAIDVDDIHFETDTASRSRPVAMVMESAAGEDDDDASLNNDLKRREWDIILNTIAAERGSRKATAERLGISQRTLRYKLARMRDAGISVPGGYAEAM